MNDLSPRQREVLALVADAWTNKRIAAQLSLSERRVRSIISSVAKRLGADATRDERVVLAKLWLEHEAA